MKLILFMLLSGLALSAVALEISEELFFGDYSPVEHQKLARKTVSCLHELERVSGVAIGLPCALYQSLEQKLADENITKMYDQCLICNLPQRSIALQLAQDSGCKAEVCNFMAKIASVEDAIDKFVESSFVSQRKICESPQRSYRKENKHILYVFGMRHARAYMASHVKRLLFPFVLSRSAAIVRSDITYTFKGLASPSQATIIKADRDAISSSLKRIIAEKSMKKESSLVQSHRYLLKLIQKSHTNSASENTVNAYVQHLYQNILPSVRADERYKSALSFVQQKISEAQRALHELLASVVRKTCTIMRNKLPLDDQEYAVLQGMFMLDSAPGLSEIDAGPRFGKAAHCVALSVQTVQMGVNQLIRNMLLHKSMRDKRVSLN